MIFVVSGGIWKISIVRSYGRRLSYGVEPRCGMGVGPNVRSDGSETLLSISVLIDCGFEGLS